MAFVEFENRDGIGVLSLNRPDALNALSPALFLELREHIDRIAEDTENVGCVVLRGNGRSFSAGNDLKAIQAGEVAPPGFQAATLDAIEAMPQPVIAVVKGHCYTGALELVLACDLLICGESARICDTHGKWGLVPTWGMPQRLPRRIGAIRAKEIMFTGRIVGAEEAVGIGLANQMVADDELDETAMGLARQCLENSWHTLRSEKFMIREGMQHGLDEGLAWERANNPGHAPDSQDRIAGFSKK